MKILVESLKLYVTLSLFLATAYLAAAREDGASIGWMLWPTGCLIACAAISIAQLNHHVYKPFATSTAGRVFNVSALLFLIAGVVAGVAGIVRHRGPQASSSSPASGTIQIEGERVNIGVDARTPLHIKRDSAGQISEILVNPSATKP